MPYSGWGDETIFGPQGWLPVDPGSRLGGAIEWAGDKANEYGGVGRAAIENSLGGPERLRSWLLDPQKPPVPPAIRAARPGAPPAAPQGQPGAPRGDFAASLEQPWMSPMRQPGMPEAPESPHVGYSWGGNPEALGANGRPAIDATVEDDFGRQGVSRESTGGGGFMASTSLKDIPFSQWPPSARRDAFKAAELQKTQAEAADPYQTGAYRARRDIDRASEMQSREGEMQRDQQQFSGLRQSLDATLRDIETNPQTAALPEEQKQKLRGMAQDRFDQAWQAYQQARLAARSGALPSGLYRPS